MENSSSNILRFEFSLPLEDLRQYITGRRKADKGELWFSGTIDKSTEKVITADITGRKSQQRIDEDINKVLASLVGSYLQDHH